MSHYKLEFVKKHVTVWITDGIMAELSGTDRDDKPAVIHTVLVIRRYSVLVYSAVQVDPKYTCLLFCTAGTYLYVLCTTCRRSPIPSTEEWDPQSCICN